MSDQPPPRDGEAGAPDPGSGGGSGNGDVPSTSPPPPPAPPPPSPSGPAPGTYPPPYGQPPYGQPPYGTPPPYGQPPYGTPPPYGQPPYGTPPPYGQPPYGTPPPYGQPPYGTPPPYGQPPYGTPPPYGQPPYGTPPPYGGARWMPPVPTDGLGRPLAEWWQRLLAILLDWVILAVPHALVAVLVYSAASSATGFTLTTSGLGAHLVVAGLISGLVSLAYFALLDGSPKGQTVGQMALGIAVVDEGNGGPIGVVRAGVRILVLLPTIAVSWLPVLGLLADVYVVVAGLSPLWDLRRQGFHDKVQHTLVVRVR